MDTELEEGLQDVAKDLSDHNAQVVYDKLCEETGVIPNKQTYFFFKSGFVSGSFVGLKAACEIDEEE